MTLILRGLRASTEAGAVQLKPPPHFEDLDNVVEALTAGAEADEIPHMCCTELVAWTHTTITRWFTNDA